MESAFKRAAPHPHVRTGSQGQRILENRNKQTNKKINKKWKKLENEAGRTLSAGGWSWFNRKPQLQRSKGEGEGGTEIAEEHGEKKRGQKSIISQHGHSPPCQWQQTS